MSRGRGGVADEIAALSAGALAVRVFWLDAATSVEDLDDDEDFEPVLQMSTGHLVRETEETLVLAQTRCEADGYGQNDTPMVINKPDVRRLEILRPAEAFEFTVRVTRRRVGIRKAR